MSETKKICVIIVAESRADDGQFIPVVVTEGETGYTPLSGKGEGSAPWTWGTDVERAMEMADDYTKKLGRSLEEADEITHKSLFPNATQTIRNARRMFSGSR